MSFNKRVNRKCYTNGWGIGRCILHITTESVTVAPDVNLAGRAWFDLKLYSRHRMRHDEYHDARPPQQGKFFEAIPAARSLCSCMSWHGITRLVDIMYPFIPHSARESMFRSITVEVKDAVEKAIFLEHSVLWISIRAEVQVEMGCDVVKLHCNHEISINKVVKWVSEHRLCPICNHEAIDV